MIRKLCLLGLVAVISYAQRTMTVAQLTGFVRSSVTEKLDDRQIAEILKKTKLTEKLEAATVEGLQNLHPGPKTMAALKDLMDASEGLPAAAPAPVKPTPRLSASTNTSPLIANDPAHSQILDAVRDYAMNYTAGLPNFICTQVTRRQVDQSGTGDHWTQLDKLQEQLTYFEHHENYKVIMINNQMVQNQDHEKLGGVVTEGEFGSMMYEIFVPETDAEFQWARLGKWDGRIMNVFNYHVPQPRSHYTIEDRNTGRKVTPGYHGTIYANRDTNAVIRITLETEEIPRDFPIQDVKINLAYDIVKITEQEFVLPVKWDMVSRDGRALVENTAEYTLYRKFGTESSITFDSSDPATDGKPPDAKKDEPPPPVKKQQQ
jgi:hypothetical protein